MGFAIRLIMVDAESLPSHRGRRMRIALLILLLILLPLYLWPLRDGLGGLPGASALLGSPRDPRSAAAVARIPSSVWDALVGRADTPPPPPPAMAPRNLTMISQLGELTGDGVDLGTGGSPFSESPSSLARGLIAQLGGPSGSSDGGFGGDDSPSSPGQFLSSNPGGGPGTENSPGIFAAGGGYPSLGDLGPWNGGGPGGGPRFSIPGPTLGPSDPGSPAPTPEPATLVLVGSNLALLGAAAWKRHRRRRETL